MAKGLISEASMQFLTDLRENNDRTWFTANKSRYTRANAEMKAFLATLVEEMNKKDQIEGSKLFRIYRDIRFSKDKTPYNSHFSMSMSRTKPFLRGGYYIRITPGNSVIACGFWNPNPKDLFLIRKNIAIDDTAFREAIGDPSIAKIFGTLEGETVKTAPKGFAKDHSAIDLIRHKQFILTKAFSDKEVTGVGFAGKVATCFHAVRPWFDYMSDILGHDLNGVPLH